MVSFKQKTILTSIGVFLFIGTCICTISLFAKLTTPQDTTRYALHLVSVNFLFTFSILVFWIAALNWVALIASSLAVAIVILTAVKTNQSAFLIFIIYFFGLHVFMLWRHRVKKEILVINDLDIERANEEKNILEKAFNEKTKALESFLHKYADYSKLRNVIDVFASTLDLSRLCHLIVNEVIDFIQKGEYVLLYLVDIDEQSLSLVASKSSSKKRRSKVKKGDIFDQWVLRNKQQLLVSDIHKDVRFDNQTLSASDFRGLISTPLIYEGRVVGTLRVNAEQEDIFSLDDLRVLSVIGNVASAALSNAFLYQKTEELAITDSLTGVYVHRYFKARLKEEYKRALITNAPLSLLMCDLDNFKTYNDRYGHTAGDIILKKVSALIGEIIGENGILARYGGEEFAVLLPRVSLHAGLEYAELIRNAIENEPFTLRGVNTGTSISIGVASIPTDTLDSEELIRKADVRLYAAKRSGKNKVIGEDV